jgi:hypothetical protein
MSEELLSRQPVEKYIFFACAWCAGERRAGKKNGRKGRQRTI